jgi:hypothetical protein
MVLPHLVAGRDLADALVDRLPGKVTDAIVVIDCRHLASGSPSFASQLVHRILSDGDARLLVIVGAPARFAGYVTDSASALDVASRLDLSAHMPVETASA